MSLTLDPKTTALVLIDLQKGILPFAGGPHTAQQVLDKATELKTRFNKLGAPVFMVRVGWSATFDEALKQPTDISAGGGSLPEDWWEFPEQLNVTDKDLLVVKRQWGAFYGTDLELQLRRRGIKTVVLCGISTNIGVESTARNAWELGFELVFAEDACSAHNADHHGSSINFIFPRIGRVRSTDEVLAAIAE
ncbi:hydrolase [Rouxiella badensis]|jgi:nicotinamidase-related amidase|uniref:Hydrolase n=1 Tax=Rouxiella badensis TaxID=1646377 RepID=A0A1X0WBS1_9GAMM|nr:hydrolase [Rouxiella badensis]MCC3703556.1 hydrolase [Rouxiella badensis]MCC3719259.1 hydrolase [Rouxiella badensis]MCC3728509.1 hydrolase [Rouxiella badensis]MCC3734405.1 hydrolase [Rouxiella badensis]MCC3742511.1 hydrolase [Rouxiella badensis]